MQFLGATNKPQWGERLGGGHHLAEIIGMSFPSSPLTGLKIERNVVNELTGYTHRCLEPRSCQQER